MNDSAVNAFTVPSSPAQAIRGFAPDYEASAMPALGSLANDQEKANEIRCVGALSGEVLRRDYVKRLSQCAHRIKTCRSQVGEIREVDVVANWRRAVVPGSPDRSFLARYVTL